MRRFAAYSIVILFAIPSQLLAAFDPAPELICSKGTPSSERRIAPLSVIRELFLSNGISLNSLDMESEKLSVMAAAMLNPRDYCSHHACGKDAADKLKMAQSEFLFFWNSYAQFKKKGPYTISPVAQDEVPNRVLEEFFRDTRTTRAICLPAKEDKPAKTDAAESKSPFEVRVRKDTNGLKIQQSSKAFKGVDRATISVTRDYVAGTDAFNIEGVVGLATGPIQFRRESSASVEFIPYLGYTRQLVRGNDDPNATNVNNVALGLISEWKIPVADYFQQLELYPQFVHSFRSRVDIVTANAVLTPDFPLPGVGGRYLPYQGAPISFLFSPQLKLVYGAVTNDGGDPTLHATGDFSRGGLRMAAMAFGEGDTVLDGWSLAASYEYLKVFKGTIDSVSHFESTLAYTMPGQEFWALEVKYVDGRNLDTFERLKQLTVGLGFKY